MRRPRTRTALLLLLGGLLLVSLAVVPDFLRGLSFVARAASLKGGVAESLARWRTVPVTEEETRLPTRYGPLRARLYRPGSHRGPPLVLTTGVHAEGIDEPRLVKLARDLAAGGRVVLTPELPDLLQYEITPRQPDMIEDAALWLASQPALAPEGRVGLVGISFSGGLSVVAAGRPSLQDKVAFTLSLGGHGELSRVLAFLTSGVVTGGERLTPHDYGLVVVLLNVADKLVPPEQVEPLREGIRTFLRASHLALHHPQEAEETFAEARRLEARLPEPAATLLGYVNTRDVAALGPLLWPHVQAFADEPSLSPERSPAPSTPVYLLHGADDNVIPARESELLARSLAPHTEVHQLNTPLITHAEVDREAEPADVWRLVSFWARLLDE